MSWTDLVPRTLDVDSHTVKVNVSKYGPRSPEGYAFGGTHDRASQTITLDPHLTERAARVTLLHELGHALFQYGGISRRDVPVKLEEYILSAVDGLVYLSLVQNPELIDFLTRPAP